MRYSPIYLPYYYFFKNVSVNTIIFFVGICNGNLTIIDFVVALYIIFYSHDSSHINQIIPHFSKRWAFVVALYIIFYSHDSSHINQIIPHFSKRREDMPALEVFFNM